jgi:alpha-1,2-mannosyltransferase
MLTAGEPSSSHPLNRPPVLRSAALLAFLILVYFFVQVLFVLPGLQAKLSDFSTFFYPAARAVLAGRSPYSVVGLNYPPLLPFVLVPLALLPSAGARLIWFALSHVFVAAAGIRMWRVLGGGWCGALAITGACATSGALFADLGEGQVNTLLLLLVVLALWPMAARPGHGPSALGVAIALKLWPGVILVGEALRCRWRAIARACGVALIFLLLPWLFVAAVLLGPTVPRRTDFWAGSPGALNGSLPGVALRLLDRPKRGAPLPEQWVAAHSVETFELTRPQAAISLGVAVVLFGVGTAALARMNRLGALASLAPLLGAAFIALTLVSAPVVWPHYHVLQIPGVAMLGERFIRRRSWHWLLFLGVATLVSTWSAALIMGPYLAHFGFVVTHPLLVWTLTSLTPAGALAILLLLLTELKRDTAFHILLPRTSPPKS